jgi:putative SOS response-associated peptidase YedK
MCLDDWFFRQPDQSEATLRDRHERRCAIRHRGHLGELEGAGVWRMERTFAIITTNANELVADIHARIPLILEPPDYARWLGEEPDPRDLMRPFPADLMRMWPISKRVNKPENDDPSILEPIELATECGVALRSVLFSRIPVPKIRHDE